MTGTAGIVVRLVVRLVMVIVVAGAGLAAATTLGGCSARVAGGLDEARANEAVALLEQHGIATTKELESGSGEARFAIDVPRAELGAALLALDSAALPRRIDRGIAETYAEASLVPSATEERARYHAAVAGELARTIQRIDGVVDVRVHVAAPESSDLGLDAPAPPARASVLVTARPLRPGGRPGAGPGSRPGSSGWVASGGSDGSGGPAMAIDTNAIRSIVVGAVDGLSPETVAVVVLPAAASPATAGRLVVVGPFRLAAGSARLLGFVLGGSILVHVATAIVLILLIRQRRSRGRRGLAREPDASIPAPVPVPSPVHVPAPSEVGFP